MPSTREGILTVNRGFHTIVIWTAQILDEGLPQWPSSLMYRDHWYNACTCMLLNNLPTIVIWTAQILYEGLPQWPSSLMYRDH